MKLIFKTIIFLMIPLGVLSQNTNINLSQEQSNEIFKGLIQGENLKQTVLDLQETIKLLEQEKKNKDEIISDLKNKISILELRLDDKNKQLENEIKICNYEMAILKDKKNKKFSFGFSAGYQIDLNDLSSISLKPYVGVGISFNILKF